MNENGVELNKEYKYKELCEVLGEEPKTNRVDHIKTLRKYYDIKKIRTKYVVLKKYNADELKILSPDGTYVSHLTDYISHYCYQHNSDHVVLTAREILEGSGMINGDYNNNYWKSHVDDYEPQFFMPICDNTDRMEEEDVLRHEIRCKETQLFFRVSYRLLKAVISNALREMREKQIIVNYGFTEDGEDDGKVSMVYYIDKNGFWRKKQASKSEEARILDVKRRTMEIFNSKVPVINGKKMYYVDVFERANLLYKKQRDEFYDILDEEFRKEFAAEGYLRLGWAYSFVLAKEGREIFYHQRALNNKIVKRLNGAKELEIMEPQIREQCIQENIKI